jgi:O-antigen ligase
VDDYLPQTMRGAFTHFRPWRSPWPGVLILPVVGLLWQSFFWLDYVPAATKVGYAGLTLLSALRPAYGLLLVACLATLGAPIGGLVGAPPQRAAEAILLTFLVGWLVQTVIRREAILDWRDSLSAPIALFALTVSASLVVTSAAVQSATAPAWPFVRLAAGLLARDYFGGTHYETHNWYQAALLIEGVLLAAAVLQLTRRRSALQAAVARMIALGLVSAAVLSLVRLGIGLLKATDPAALLMRAVSSLRLSMHVTDVNAAGSHFVLALPLIWALGMMARRWRPAWWLGLLPVIAALWLTGSRAAQLSILLTLTAVMAVADRRRARIRVLLVVAAFITIVGGIIVSRPAPESSVAATLQIRWWFAQLSWDMFKSAPLFGVGVAEYYGRSAGLMPEGLKALYVAENAHNNFFQIGVELGLVGLGLFLWVLRSAWRRARVGLSGGDDPLLRGLCLGLGTVLLTFLTGHPLLIGAFVCSFWIALALAVSRADTVNDQSASEARVVPAQVGSAAPSRWPMRAAVAVALAVVASVPFREDVAGNQANLSVVRYGFAPGGVDPVSKDSFLWAGPSATMFVAARVQSLYLSVSPPSDDEAVELEIRIDGRLANHVVLRDGFWRDMRLILPAADSSHAFRRIDLVVSRAGDDRRPGSRQRDPDSAGPRVRVRTVRAK